MLITSSLSFQQCIVNKINLWILLLLSFVASTSINAKETIHWATYDFKPLHLLEGKNANTGIADQIISFIQQQLPQHDHENYSSVMVRILRDLQGSKLTCSGMLKRKFWADSLIFSLPVLQIPNHSLQFPTSRLAEIEEMTGQSFSQPVSLEALIKSHPTIKVSITEHRSYGEKIDSIIERYQDNFIHNSAQVRIVDQLKFIQKKRATFTLEYPFVSAYAFRNITAPPYHSTKLLELEDHLLGHIVCNNTKQGQQVITEINQIISTHWLTAPYRDIVEQWLPDSSIQSYRLQYEKIRKQYQ